MSVMVRIQSIWNGFQGAPGYTNLYFLSDGDAVAAANAAAPRVRAFWAAVAGLINVDCSVKVQRTYQVLDSVTGNISAEGTLTSDPAVVPGTGTGVYSAPAGACIMWETGTFNPRGHRVRGRTFFVPMNGTGYENDGTLAPATITTLVAAGTTLIGTSPLMLVWTRPSSAGAADGTATTISSCVVHDRAAVLRSRRD